MCCIRLLELVHSVSVPGSQSTVIPSTTPGKVQMKFNISLAEFFKKHSICYRLLNRWNVLYIPNLAFILHFCEKSQKGVVNYRNYNKNLAFTLSYFCDLIQNVGIMEGSTCIKNKNTVPIQQKFLMWYLYAQC